MLVKLSEHLSVFVRELEHARERTVLVVDKVWASKNQSAIRDFFIKLYSDKSGLPRVEKMERALSCLDCKSAVAKWKDDEAVYLVKKGDAGVWLVRGLKVVKLLDENEDSAKVSGWLKKRDVYFWSLDANKTSGIEIKLLELAVLLSRSRWQVPVNRISQSLEVMIDHGAFYLVENAVDRQMVKIDLSKNIPDIRDDELLENEKDELLTSKRKFSLDWSKGRVIFEKIKLQFGRLSKFGEPAVRFANYLVSKLPTEDAVYAIETSAVKAKLRSRNRKILLSFAIVLLVSLSASIAWGIKQRRQAEWDQKFGELLVEARDKLAEGKQLAELNPSRARDLANQAGQLIQTLKSRGLEEENLSSLESQLGNVLGIASGVKQVEVEIWMSLDLIRENMAATDMAWFDDEMVILDEQENRVVLIDVTDKSFEVVAAKEQIGEARKVGLYGKSVFIMSNRGILEIEEGDVSVVTEMDEDWGSVFDMRLYAGNIYLATSKGVWKYPVIESGFGSKQPWLVEETDPILGTVSMDIDGYVWLAGKDWVRKFAGGVEDRFSLLGEGESLTDIRILFTDEDSNFLYFLEPGEKRVVVVEKDTGKYKNQYVAEELVKATDLVVREEEGYILVLAGDKILELSL